MCIFIAFPTLGIPEIFISLIDMINARFDLKPGQTSSWAATDYSGIRISSPAPTPP